MVASPEIQGLLPTALQRARRLRVLANDCRDVARITQHWLDQERMLKMAQQHDAEADQLEAAATPKE